MCIRFEDRTVLTWLRAQLRVMEAWREDIAGRTTVDISMVSRLEAHYQWLTNEIAYLEGTGRPLAARR